VLPPAAAASPDATDVLALLRDLGATEGASVRGAIARWDAKDARPVPFLIALLAREDLHADAIGALARAGDRIAGALAERRGDPDEAFAVRRRIPRLLAACTSEIAVGALVRALADARFEVRYHAAVALERIQSADPRLRPRAEPVWHAVREEVKKSRAMWEAQRLLDAPAGAALGAVLSPAALERRGVFSLDHVFRLLGLVLDPAPLALSYRAVQGSEADLRGVGLEYLENVLPDDVKKGLWPLVGDDEPPPLSRSKRSLDEVMRELSRSISGAPPR
jgi:hypothetical protein